MIKKLMLIRIFWCKHFFLYPPLMILMCLEYINVCKKRRKIVFNKKERAFFVRNWYFVGQKCFKCPLFTFIMDSKTLDSKGVQRIYWNYVLLLFVSMLLFYFLFLGIQNIIGHYYYVCNVSVAYPTLKPLLLYYATSCPGTLYPNSIPKIAVPSTCILILLGLGYLYLFKRVVRSERFFIEPILFWIFFVIYFFFDRSNTEFFLTTLLSVD